MRKQFVFIRFGINNFDNEWFDWRLHYLDKFSIQGFENNAHDKLYIVFAVNKNSPLSVRRKLIEIFERSKVRSNFHLIEIDLYSQIVPAFLHFLKLHVNENERFMVTRLDTDDIWAPGLLEYVDNCDQETGDTGTMAYTFPEGVEFFVNERHGFLDDKPRGSLNNFIYTSDQSICPYQWIHARIHRKASAMGWQYKEVRNGNQWWLRALTDDNTFEWELGSEFYNDYIEGLKKNKTLTDWRSICEQFKIDEQRALLFYDRFKKVPSTSGFLAYKDYGSIGRAAKENIERYQRLIDVIVENFSNESTSKPKTRELLFSIMEKEQCTYLRAVDIMLSNGIAKGSGSDGSIPLSEPLHKAVERLSVSGDTAVVIVLKGNDTHIFDRVCQAFGFFPDSLRSDRSLAAIWDGKKWSLHCDESRLSLDHTLIEEPKTLHLRIISNWMKGYETGQVFVGDHISKGKSNEWDWSMNEPGVNVVAVSLKEAGRMIDSFALSGSDEEVHRFYYNVDHKSTDVKGSQKTDMIQDGWYSIKLQSDSDYSLDIRAGSSSDGARLQLFKINNSKAQRFFIKNLGIENGYLIFTGTNSKKSVLAIKGEPIASGNVIQQFVHDGSPGQIWNLTINEDGSVTFTDRSGTLAMDIAGNKITDGVRMIVYDKNDSATQKYVITPLELQ